MPLARWFLHRQDFSSEQAMNLEIARKAFIRIRDVRHVELVNRTELGRKQGLPESLLMAEIMAYQGRYQDAARLYTQGGRWTSWHGSTEVDRTSWHGSNGGTKEGGGTGSLSLHRLRCQNPVSP